MRDYLRSNWQPIIELAKTAEFFQDVPFSLDKTFRILHRHFPEAKFILTTRRNPEEWYQSITRFHTAKFGTGGNPPTENELRRASYRYPGYMWDYNRALFETPASDPYEREGLIKWYSSYLGDVRRYFGDKPNFLELEIGDAEASQKIATFVGLTEIITPIPHLNKWPE